MGIFQLWGSREADDDMARRQQKQLDSAKVDAWAHDLKASMSDAEAFAAVYAALACDKSLLTAEIVEISFRVTGTRAKTKKQALASIGQQRLRLAHARAKSASALKTRTW